MIPKYTLMAPTLVREPFHRADWVYEEKVDGWRIVAYKDGERARLWHPWLRIYSVVRVMLQTRWSAEAWSVVRVEFKRALELLSQIRRAGWFN